MTGAVVRVLGVDGAEAVLNDGGVDGDGRAELHVPARDAVHATSNDAAVIMPQAQKQRRMRKVLAIDSITDERGRGTILALGLIRVRRARNGQPRRAFHRRMQQLLYFRPPPHGHGSLRPILLPGRTTGFCLPDAAWR